MEEGERVKTVALLIVLAFVVLLTSGCMAAPNPLEGTASREGYRAGLVDGLLHGVISLPMIFWKFGGASEGIYEVRNNGLPYNLGFVLGLGLLSFFAVLIGMAGEAKNR